MTRFIAASFAALVLVGSVVALSGCNTTAGAGQDVSGAGRAVTRGAEEVKQKL